MVFWKGFWHKANSGKTPQSNNAEKSPFDNLDNLDNLNNLDNLDNLNELGGL